MSWCQAPYVAHDRMFVNCLTVTVLSFSLTLSDNLTRGWVCLLSIIV
jgi:hypothetical protein